MYFTRRNSTNKTESIHLKEHMVVFFDFHYNQNKGFMVIKFKGLILTRVIQLSILYFR